MATPTNYLGLYFKNAVIAYRLPTPCILNTPTVTYDEATGITANCTITDAGSGDIIEHGFLFNKINSVPQYWQTGDQKTANVNIKNFAQATPDEPWVDNSSYAHSGIFCLKSGGAGIASALSRMDLTVIGPTTLQYWVKTDSEYSDKFYLYMDDVLQLTRNGGYDYTMYTLTIPEGSHVISFVYSKDASVNTRTDSAYVDDLILTPNTFYDSAKLLGAKTQVANDVFTSILPPAELTQGTWYVRAFVINPAGITYSIVQTVDVGTVVQPPTGWGGKIFGVVPGGVVIGNKLIPASGISKVAVGTNLI